MKAKKPGVKHWTRRPKTESIREEGKGNRDLNEWQIQQQLERYLNETE